MSDMVALTLCQMDARFRALEASLDRVLSEYRMAGFPRPFRNGGAGQRFNHLFPRGGNPALCGGLAAVHPNRLQPADLSRVDCLACLDALTERTRPCGA